MSKKQTILDTLFLTITGAIIFSLFSGSYPFMILDETRYIEVAREMAASGNYITPHLNGSIFLDKPILFYWLESFLIYLFGLHEWSARLVPEFFGVLGCLFSYWAGIKLFNRRTGLLAALILMSMALYFGIAHYANLDLMVAILISCSLWSLIIALNETKNNAQWYYLFAYVFSGLAFLTKGLMGLVFPASILACWMIYTKKWATLNRMHFVAGIIIIACIITPWMVLVEHQTGFFFYYFFYIQQFARYLGNNFNDGAPFYYYGEVILLGILPWAFFLLQTLVYFVKHVTKTTTSSNNELFIFIWAVFIFIFFSIPTSKPIGYILPVFPPLAMMIARYLDRQWALLEKTKRFYFYTLSWAVFSAVFSFVLFYQGPKKLPDNTTQFYFLSAIFLLSAIATILFTFLKKKRFAVFFTTLLITWLLFEVTVIASLKKVKLNSNIVLINIIKNNIKPNNKIICYEDYYRDIPLYLNHNMLMVSRWNQPLPTGDDWRAELGEDLIYQHHQQPHLINPTQLVILWHQPNRLFVLVSPHNVKNLKELVGAPVYTLGEANGTLLVSNKQ